MVIEREKKVDIAVVSLVKSGESKQKATPSFDIWTEQSIMSASSFTACS